MNLTVIAVPNVEGQKTTASFSTYTIKNIFKENDLGNIPMKNVKPYVVVAMQQSMGSSLLKKVGNIPGKTI